MNSFLVEKIKKELRVTDLTQKEERDPEPWLPPLKCPDVDQDTQYKTPTVAPSSL